MRSLVELIDEHPREVRYDLLRHGYRLEDLGTSSLPWGDAVTIITVQPMAGSAVWAKLHPDEYDHDRTVDRLEKIAVILVRTQMMMGVQTEVKMEDLPTKWDDLFAPPVEEGKSPNGTPLLSFEEIDERMGWTHDEVELTEQELLSFEEIDKRMGWSNG